jgi:hypothetical protein
MPDLDSQTPFLTRICVFSTCTDARISFFAKGIEISIHLALQSPAGERKGICDGCAPCGAEVLTQAALSHKFMGQLDRILESMYKSLEW